MTEVSYGISEVRKPEGITYAFFVHIPILCERHQLDDFIT